MLAVLAVPVVAVGGLGHVTGRVLVAAAVTGVCCSALAFTLQLWGQRFVEPARAAVILEFEPVVAGIIGYWVGRTTRGGRVHRRGRHPDRHRHRRIAVVAGRPGSLTDRSSAVRIGAMTEPTKPRAPFAPWDRRELPGLFTVEETARRVGNYKWAEMRLFEVLGGWVATVPELDVKLVLGRHTYHHAWHAELWHKRLPELREMNTDRLTVPPNDEFVTFMDAGARARGARPDDREARRRLPRAHPAVHRGVHVPPQQHQHASPTRRRSGR